jgi:hypothetical protein
MSSGLGVRQGRNKFIVHRKQNKFIVHRKQVHRPHVKKVITSKYYKSAAECVRTLLLLGPLLRHDITTLDARIPLLASAWRW